MAELVALQRLTQNKEVMLLPIAFETFYHLLPLVFENLHIAQFAERNWIALPGENGFDDSQSTDPVKLADHCMEADIHQIQRSLHVLDVRSRDRQMILAQPVKAAQLPNVLRRDEAARQQPVAVQHGMPLAVEHIAFASGHIAGAGSIEHRDIHSLALKQIVDGYPINAGRFHRYFGNAVLFEVRCGQLQISTEGGEAAHLRIARTGDEDFFLANVDGGIAGVDLVYHGMFFSFRGLR